MTTQPKSASYTIDPTHSRIGFIVRHAMISKVRGSFDEFEGTGTFDAENLGNSQLNVSIATASIDTRNTDRDEHLRQNDFLDIATYPAITFTSTAATALSDTSYRVTGDLTIKGIAKSIDLDLEFTGTAVDPWGNTRIGLEGSTVINRKDWGISWNAPLDAGGVLIGENVTLEFEISAIQVAAPAE
jgi:polyisoprenoid-binding protein YceI